MNLALLTDGLRAEREQGITIDVAYRYFATPRRKFIIADTPGHVRYTRNMVTGASTADLSIILVDARNGVVEQSRRHAFIASLLGVPHLVVCVNKMDLVDWSCERLRADRRGLLASSPRELDVKDITFIPMSALQGDNVVDRSSNMPWYEGPPLLYHLEHVLVASDRNLIDARFPVQWVIRPMTDEHHDYRGYAGQVAGGILRPGEDVVVLPSGARSKIAGIDVHDGPVDEALPADVGDAAARGRPRRLARRHDRAAEQPPDRVRLVRRDGLLDERAAAARGRPLHDQAHDAAPRARPCAELRYRIDVNTLHRDPDAERARPERHRPRDAAAQLAARASTPTARNRTTGSFVLIDEATNDTVGAGHDPRARTARTPAAEAGRGQPERHLARRRRPRRALGRCSGQRGAVVWMTGLPSSGKSTVAHALEQR